MFEESLFTSQFWDWFITIITLGGIFACFGLIYWLGADFKKTGDKVETMGHVWDGNLEEYNNPLPRWWLNMFYITLIFGLVYLVLYPGLGSYMGVWNWTELKEYRLEMWAADTRYGPLYEKYQNEPITALVENENAKQLGHSLFMTYCTTCHGSDARGVPGYPNLRDEDWLYGGSPAAIETTIKNGRQGQMPAWEPAIGENGVKQVTQYVLSLSGRDHDSAAAAKGQKTYTAMCIACHGPTGKGNQMLGAPNLTDDIWFYGGSPKRIETTIAKGRQGKMPAHGDFLGEAKVHLLANYIYSLSN
ncbi:MAG: cytochrome-c oxidase, cbb3-type subunit III [Candidatus Parabeggiatoa sp. nov. 3]|nr:MAG: cytochrome-c oxidase, cbb3-type subunit III [Gammaproteobacteria bacterium]RKZ69228.1 MAG: cytochrome-c oxidase, cbb3-type subunit III [Gammaproteobacteria bacterium]RKZ82513.1 MAG: cytochrome-c oxidase, cbb3-type subunit III [Gammaproteobacteria bacterium]